MERVIIPVHPSRHQRYWLVALALLLLWPVSTLVTGWQWTLFVPVWLLAFALSWRALPQTPFELEWDGQWLRWQSVSYRLGNKSRILPGVLRLELHPEQGRPCVLWLFADALAPDHSRLLARAINFPADRR
ncbi:hypothetical protein AjGTCBM29_04252 [Aeromonas jandaei]|nr:hypothetical protein AjGTCBM29_04252 [Aeromonas jandaei]